MSLLCSELFAKAYKVDGTDMSMTIDDEYWYVFTRDNIKGNNEFYTLMFQSTAEFLDE